MQKPLKVVAFNGSARKGGNTAILLRYALKEMEKEGIETELIELSGETIHGCRSCQACSKAKNHKCSQTTDIVNDCIAKMEAADGILLGSPTYFCNITPEISALMDRACYVARANGGLFRHKVGASIAVARRAGTIPVFDALNRFFLFSEMVVPGSTYWNVGIGLAPGDIEQDAEAIQIVQTLGQNMTWLLKKLAD
jgi:multimeric flavodoxin WrbA